MNHNKSLPDSKIKLKTVSSSDYKFLYTLLSQRLPEENISHKKMPTFNKHRKFVSSKPYSKWYIIIVSNKKVGSIYLTNQSEIGIQVIDGMRGKNIAKKALELLIKKTQLPRYLANINPQNKKSIKFFTKHGFKLIQYTYELIPSFSKN